MVLRAGKSVVDGYLFMGNYSSLGQLEGLKFCPGRKWDVPYSNYPENVIEAINKNFKSGWVPVQEYIDYLNITYGKINPKFVEHSINNIG